MKHTSFLRLATVFVAPEIPIRFHIRIQWNFPAFERADMTVGERDYGAVPVQMAPFSAPDDIDDAVVLRFVVGGSGNTILFVAVINIGKCGTPGGNFYPVQPDKIFIFGRPVPGEPFFCEVDSIPSVVCNSAAGVDCQVMAGQSRNPIG